MYSISIWHVYTIIYYYYYYYYYIRNVKSQWNIEAAAQS